MAGFPMTLGNPQKQRNDTVSKVAVVNNVPLQISASKFQPILQQGLSADTRKYSSWYFPSQYFS